LIAVVLLVLLAAMVAAAGVAMVARNRDAATRFPVADQIAALHALLDRAPADLRPLIVRAANSDTLSVTIEKERPARADYVRRLPGVEWLIAHYLLNLSSSEVYASAHNELSLVWRILQPFAPVGDGEVMIAVSMRSGEFLVLGLKGTPAARVYGIPVGFWVGALGASLAALLIGAVIRESRPIAALARSVSAFGVDATPRPVEATGAPDIRTLITEINAMQARVADLLRARTVLLGAISHDLKSYLTRLRLRVEDLPDEASRDRAVRDVDDMTRIIDDSLAVARGAAPLARRDRVVLSTLIAADLADRDAARVLVFISDEAAGLTVIGDETGLRRVLTNVVDNALAHGTRCRIALARADDAAVLTIADDGPGIAPGDLEAVFEPFWRADTSRSRATGGHGLGLAISRQIIAAHGGTITAANAHPAGAVFTIRLPLAA
jgi:signal transduction histidine kinase